MAAAATRCLQLLLLRLGCVAAMRRKGRTTASLELQQFALRLRVVAAAGLLHLVAAASRGECGAAGARCGRGLVFVVRLVTASTKMWKRRISLTLPNMSLQLTE